MTLKRQGTQPVLCQALDRDFLIVDLVVSSSWNAPAARAMVRDKSAKQVVCNSCFGTGPRQMKGEVLLEDALAAPGCLAATCSPFSLPLLVDLADSPLKWAFLLSWSPERGIGFRPSESLLRQPRFTTMATRLRPSSRRPRLFSPCTLRPRP